MKRIPSPGTCVIVGGGPSLNDFDFESLHGSFVIALNYAAERVPFADVVLFGNESWYRANRALLASHPGEKHRIRFSSVAAPLHDPDVIEWTSSGRKGLDMTPGFLRSGRTCAYTSINLAAQLGARRITLLGFDFIENGRGARTCPIHPKEFYADELKALIGPLKTLGVEVFNASAISAATAFPKAKENPASLGMAGGVMRYV